MNSTRTRSTRELPRLSEAFSMILLCSLRSTEFVQQARAGFQCRKHVPRFDPYQRGRNKVCRERKDGGGEAPQVLFEERAGGLGPEVRLPEVAEDGTRAGIVDVEEASGCSAGEKAQEALLFSNE